MELAETMRRHYFPVIPGLGMPGWLLSGGVNRYFRANRIPLKVSFGVLGRNFRNRIGAMLAHDIPVILAVCYRQKDSFTIWASILWPVSVRWIPSVVMASNPISRILAFIGS